jgi:hypothetical protein
MCGPAAAAPPVLKAGRGERSALGALLKGQGAGKEWDISAAPHGASRRQLVHIRLVGHGRSIYTVGGGHTGKHAKRLASGATYDTSKLARQVLTPAGVQTPCRWCSSEACCDSMRCRIGPASGALLAEGSGCSRRRCRASSCARRSAWLEPSRRCTASQHISVKPYPNLGYIPRLGSRTCSKHAHCLSFLFELEPSNLSSP